ncbi:unnamed protein product, partial [Ectocarpus sp. 4 AP-2014]
ETWDLPATETRVVEAEVQGGDETPGESDNSTGFGILSPDPSRVCRVVRGRRCRPVRTVSQRAKKVRPFEISERNKTTPSTSDATTTISVVVDVAIAGAFITTSSERHYGNLKHAVGARGSPFFCHRGFAPRGMGLGSIRGGATPAEEEADTHAQSAPLSFDSSPPGGDAFRLGESPPGSKDRRLDDSTLNSVATTRASSIPEDSVALGEGVGGPSVQPDSVEGPAAE